MPLISQTISTWDDRVQRNISIYQRQQFNLPVPVLERVLKQPVLLVQYHEHRIQTFPYRLYEFANVLFDGAELDIITLRVCLLELFDLVSLELFVLG